MYNKFHTFINIWNFLCRTRGGRLTRIGAIISVVTFIISGILTIIFGTLYDPNPCFHITN